MIPDWLREGSLVGPCPCCTVAGSSRKGLVERSLRGFAAFLGEARIAESYARRRGLLQSVDPRFKVIASLVLVVAVSMVTKVEWIVGIYVFSLVLAKASGVELASYLKRVWLVVPLFTGVVVAPAMFSFVVPGEPLVILLRKGQTVGLLVSPWDVSLTVQGVATAAVMVIRTATAVSLMVLLALTTRWNDLLASLQSLLVPKALVMILGMTFRYVFFLVKIAEDMHLALRSRSIKPLERRNVRQWTASRISMLLRRSLAMSEGVHLAMVSRGFDGRVRRVSRFHASAFDWTWLAFFIIISVMLLVVQNTRVG